MMDYSKLKLNIKSIRRAQVSFFFSVLLAISIPFSLHLLPIILALWTLASLVNKDFYRQIRESFSDRKVLLGLLLMELFYLLHIVGMVYTENKSVGWFDVQVKLSLALVPFLVIGIRHELEKNLKYILSAFVLGLTLASLACYILATVHSISFMDGKLIFDPRPFPGSTDSYFSYQLFSHFVLPTYFATFLNLGIAILIYFMYQKIKFSYFSVPGMVLLILFFSVTVFLLSSRAGLVTWFLLFTTFLLFTRFRKKIFNQWFTIMYPLILIVALFTFTVINGHRFQPIVHEIHDAEHVEQQTVLGSVGLRIVLWKAALRSSSDHRIFGVGTGDIRDILYRTTGVPGLEQAEEKNLNVHNQFLETYLGLGIPGLLVLLFLMFYPVTGNGEHLSLLLVLFLVIVAFNFVFECMLDRLSGVVFFAFFYSLFVLVREQNSLLQTERRSKI